MKLYLCLTVFILCALHLSAFVTPARKSENISRLKSHHRHGGQSGDNDKGIGNSGNNGGNGGESGGKSARDTSDDGSDDLSGKIISGGVFSLAFAQNAKDKAKDRLAGLKIPGFDPRLPFQWYLQMLEKRPLLTKSLTSGIIAITGDWAAQSVAHSLKLKDSTTMKGYNLLSLLTMNGKYNLRRGFACACDGLFISGPIMHLAYDLFERVFPVSTGGSLAAISHVVADSLMLDSIFIATALIMTGILEGYSFKTQIIPQFRTDYLPAIRASWITSTSLIPIEFLCFRYLPLSLRTLSMNFTSVIWDGVIYFMAHRSR